MRKLARLLVVLFLVAFQMPANTENSAPDFVDLISLFPLNHSVDESVQVNIAIDPRKDLEEPASITYRLVLVGGNPFIANVVDDMVSMVGLGTFELKYGSAQPNGQASLDVNGQELCCVDVVNNRMTYLVTLQRRREASFLSGGEIPIPIPTRATVATVVFDADTGETHSTDVVPIGVLDDNTIVSPSPGAVL